MTGIEVLRLMPEDNYVWLTYHNNFHMANSVKQMLLYESLPLGNEVKSIAITNDNRFEIVLE